MVRPTQHTGPKTTGKIDDALESRPLDPSKKPKNAPNVEKWEAKGGSVHQNSDGSVTYTDWEGNKVTYKDDAADFGPHSRKEVEIDEMVGDHYHDYKAANKKAGYGEGAYDHPDGTTWHHKDTTTMQNADSKIHERFTHRGGVSKKKN